MTMQGHTILVAGGTRGIGRGLAELLCRLGNEVLVFDAEPGAAQAVAHANAGMRAVDLDLADPWSVAGFSEQVAATCPGLNMLVNISIAFPVKYLPGLQALLDEDDSHEKLEAHRLGMQHLTGALLPHFRKRPHSAVLNVSAGPAFSARRADSVALDGGWPASVMSVKKRWASASIDVIDVAVRSRAERMSPDHAPRAHGVNRADFISGVAHLLAEGLHEAAALSKLQAMWPATRPAPRKTQDDDLVSEAY
ncbi:SDR family NAD(P)-dependent oxidoreductase [Roseateles sp. NT4]|uniref:SDR family NAD(P)-dependent oxidoreductase n=1 Tax=Roseateles sp. NT4 TaxID=3453715 RepID=UPI003EEA10A0